MKKILLIFIFFFYSFNVNANSISIGYSSYWPKPFDIENLIKWKIVEGGMIPKIENCVDAVENGVRGVVILDGRKPHSVLHEIFSDTGSGTLIRK